MVKCFILKLFGTLGNLMRCRLVKIQNYTITDAKMRLLYVSLILNIPV